MINQEVFFAVLTKLLAPNGIDHSTRYYVLHKDDEENVGDVHYADVAGCTIIWDWEQKGRGGIDGLFDSDLYSATHDLTAFLLLTKGSHDLDDLCYKEAEIQSAAFDREAPEDLKRCYSDFAQYVVGAKSTQEEKENFLHWLVWYNFRDNKFSSLRRMIRTA